MQDNPTTRDGAIRSFALLLQAMGAIVHPVDLNLSRWMVGLDSEYGVIGQLFQLVADRLDVIRDLSAVEAWEIVTAWFEAELSAVAAGESATDERLAVIARKYTGAACVHCGRVFGPADEATPCDYTPAGRELYSCTPSGICRAVDEPELDELSIQRAYNRMVSGADL